MRPIIACLAILLAFNAAGLAGDTLELSRNVLVRLCSIESCFAEPIETGKHNKRFRDDLQGWSRISPQLFIWDYVANFHGYLLPHPNLYVLAPNLRYFVRNKAIGVFEQGDSGSRTGDFIRLRAWLLAHLLWNPQADENKLIDDFLAGYYGPAAPFLRNYLDLMNRAGRQSAVKVGCYAQNTKAWLTLDTMNRATRLFDKALDAVAGNPLLKERVRRERLPLDHVWLRRYKEFSNKAKHINSEFLGPKDPKTACEEFIRLSKKHNVGEFRQAHHFSQYEKTLRQQCSSLQARDK